MKKCVLVSLMMVAVFATAAPAAIYNWDTNATGGYQGGNGIWGTGASDLYWSTNGTTLSKWMGGTQDAKFRSDLTSGGTVAVGANINIKSLTVEKSGYTFSSGAGTYIRVASNSTGSIPTPVNAYFTINATATFDVNLTQYGTGATDIGNLIMGGSATDVLTLKRGNAYIGTTAINSGTLKLDGIGAINTSSNIYIASGAYMDVTTKTDAFSVGNSSYLQALKGNGRVIGNMSVADNGTVLPGDTLTTSNLIGTLSVTGDATINSGSDYNVDVASNLTSDKLAITGNVNLTTGVNLNLAGAFKSLPANGDYYTILSYTGTLTGTFGTVTGLAPNWAVSYDTPGEVRLLAVPEPATMVMLVLGSVVCMFGRRKVSR